MQTTPLFPILVLILQHRAVDFQRTSGPAAEHVSIRVFNMAHVPPSTLAPAEQEVSRVFKVSGITVTWRLGAPDAFEASSQDQSAIPCSGPLRSTELLVRIIRGMPKSWRPEVLGMALPCAAFGPQATIFWNRIAPTAAARNISTSRVLAYAMAHEIGHVLLRSNDHGRSGIMRDIWGDSEWNSVANGTLWFTAEEANVMRNSVRKTEHPSP